MRTANRGVVGWALYDWANSAFATTVMAGFFPVFFKEYWARDLAAPDSTFWLGVSNSAASLVMMLAAPVLGALADRSGRTKRYLGIFCVLGVLATALLAGIPDRMWPLALAAYLLGALGFAASNLYYDALLPRIAPSDKLEQVSALGFALGYLGGGILFAVNVAMVRWPDLFGFEQTAEAIRWSFVTVALWWGVFALPLFLWTPGPVNGRTRTGLVSQIRAGLKQVIGTVREMRRYPGVLWFLAAYWLYIDGVDTVVRMAADYGLAIGLEASSLMVALLVTQFVGFPSAIVFGILGRHIGPKRGILIGLAIYILIVLWAYRMETTAEFFVLAVAVGLVQGGVQALSRALYARLVPVERSGEFFGFYNMMGKFAAVLGPVLVGVVAVVAGDNRPSILAVALLFLAGGALLFRLKLPDKTG